MKNDIELHPANPSLSRILNRPTGRSSGRLVTGLGHFLKFGFSCPARRSRMGHKKLCRTRYPAPPPMSSPRLPHRLSPYVSRTMLRRNLENEHLSQAYAHPVAAGPSPEEAEEDPGELCWFRVGSRARITSERTCARKPSGTAMTGERQFVSSVPYPRRFRSMDRRTGACGLFNRAQSRHRSPYQRQSLERNMG